MKHCLIVKNDYSESTDLCTLQLESEEFSPETLYSAATHLTENVSELIEYFVVDGLGEVFCNCRFKFGNEVILDEFQFWSIVLSNYSEGGYKLHEYLRQLKTLGDKYSEQAQMPFAQDYRVIGSQAVEAYVQTIKEERKPGVEKVYLGYDILMTYISYMDLDAEMPYEDDYFNTILDRLFVAKEHEKYLELLYMRLFNGQRAYVDRTHSYLNFRIGSRYLKPLLDLMIEKENNYFKKTGFTLHDPDDFAFIPLVIYGSCREEIEYIFSYINSKIPQEIEFDLDQVMKLSPIIVLMADYRLQKHPPRGRKGYTGFHRYDLNKNTWVKV